MGCELVVPRWRVQFEYEGYDGLDTWSSPLNAEFLTITDMTPPFPPGWYLRKDQGYIRLLSATDIREYDEDYGAEFFAENYTLVDVVIPGEDEVK